jgi:hypothetical protein
MPSSIACRRALNININVLHIDLAYLYSIRSHLTLLQTVLDFQFLNHG